MASELVRYDAMCRAISDTLAVDEVKKIRDQAAALAEYARQAKNREAEQQCQEIRVRAEARWGDLYKASLKARAGRPPENSFPRESNFRGAPTLKDMGVSDKQSHEWQRLSDVPKDQFEEALANLENPSAAGVLEYVKPKPVTPVSDEALWLCGRLRDFEVKGYLARDPALALATMVPTMVEEVLRLAPQVSAWLAKIGENHGEED
jgi:hypothetical protein